MQTIEFLKWCVEQPTRAKHVTIETITNFEVKSLGKHYDWFINAYGGTPMSKVKVGTYGVVQGLTNEIKGHRCDFYVNNGVREFYFFKLEDAIG